MNYTISADEPVLMGRAWEAPATTLCTIECEKGARSNTNSSGSSGTAIPTISGKRSSGSRDDLGLPWEERRYGCGHRG